MTRKKHSAQATDWKALLSGQEDFLRSVVEEVVQQDQRGTEAAGAGGADIPERD